MSRSEDSAEEEGAIVCSHVFAGTRPALLAIRSQDGILQLLCGEWDHEDADGAELVGVEHLLEDDPTLAPALEIEAGYLAEREKKSSPWAVEPFDEEEEEEGFSG